MAIVNITVENDADFSRVFQYVTIDSGTPIDIGGSTFEMMLRRRAEDVAVLLRLGTDTGEIVIVDPLNGLFSVTIKQPVLERLGLGQFDQSNIMTTLAGAKVRIWSGTFQNNAGPTR